MPNEIKLYGDIGKNDDGTGITAQMVKTQLAKMDQTQPLVVRIDSFGGSVFDGQSMYEAFASYPGPKKAVIETTAMSIASYIAMAFDDVEMASNGYMMIHSPYMDGGGGTAEELANMATLAAKLKQDLAKAYATKTGMSDEAVQAMLAKDTYLNAEEALSMGLVNRINQVRATPKIRPQARHQNMPQKVYAALFSADPSGEKPRNSKEKHMSEGPVAATLSEIKAAFPKAKADFVLNCLERQLPMASVATAAVEEMMNENAALKAELDALKAEAAAKAAEETVTVTEEEEPAPEAKAKARGVQPVARAVAGAQAVNYRAQWNEAVEKCAARCGGDRIKGARMANKEYKHIREAMVSEANGQ